VNWSEVYAALLERGTPLQEIREADDHQLVTMYLRGSPEPPKSLTYREQCYHAWRHQLTLRPECKDWTPEQVETHLAERWKVKAAQMEARKRAKKETAKARAAEKRAAREQQRKGR
jgi:hypothetical protein